MIVGASSNSGDLIVDPFCGSGTTLAAADDLGRHFIGFDESFVAVEAALNRLRFGVKPMGDFIDREAAEQNQASFDELLCVAGADSAAGREFNFLADSELFAGFRQDIKRLALI
jgi:adenine-specific DNA-methyltransferase